jgi:hypothetical protein
LVNQRKGNEKSKMMETNFGHGEKENYTPFQSKNSKKPLLIVTFEPLAIVNSIGLYFN